MILDVLAHHGVDDGLYGLGSPAHHIGRGRRRRGLVLHVLGLCAAGSLDPRRGRGGHRVARGRVAHIGVVAAVVGIGVHAVGAAVAHKRGEVLDGARARVVDGDLVLATGRVQLDGREALYLVGHVVERGVDFCDGDARGVRREEAREFVVLWRQALAVAAPRRVKLQQHVARRVHDDIGVAVRHDHVRRARGLLGGDRLGLDARRHRAGDEGLDKCRHGGDVERLPRGGAGHRELEILDRVLDCKRGPRADFEIEVLRMLAEGAGVNGSQVDRTLVLLRCRFELRGVSRALLRRLGKDVAEWNAGLLARWC